MPARPRFLSRRLSATQRRGYLAATLWFAFAAAAMIWPGYTLANRVRPLLLGMPMSLFWLAVLLVGSFLAGLALYRWEDRQGVFDAEDRERRSR